MENIKSENIKMISPKHVYIVYCIYQSNKKKNFGENLVFFGVQDCIIWQIIPIHIFIFYWLNVGINKTVYLSFNIIGMCTEVKDEDEVIAK